MKKIPFLPSYFIQFSKLHIKTKKYIPEKLPTWVHSSITPFMNLKDSLCKVSLFLLLFILCPCGLVKFLLLLLLVENVWFMHCILGASCIKSLSDEALRVLLFVVKLWTASSDTVLFEESRSNILEVTSTSSRLSTLSGKFLTKSCPILKESVWTKTTGHLLRVSPLNQLVNLIFKINSILKKKKKKKIQTALLKVLVIFSLNVTQLNPDHHNLLRISFYISVSLKNAGSTCIW